MLQRNIFTYWEQGFDHAPGVIVKCLQQMQRLHPTWTVNALDQHSIGPLAGERPVSAEIWGKLGRAHRSDLLRTQLLIRHGGVWMDPTVFCVRPLDDWLPDCMAGGVFFFQKPGPDRLISNWFIAAERGNLILERLLARLVAFWERASVGQSGLLPNPLEKLAIRVLERHHRLSRWRVREPWRRLFSESPYMVYHYILSDLVLTDPEAKAVWRRVPGVPAGPPHDLQDFGLCKPANSEVENLLAGGGAPVFKLTWKDLPEIPAADTILGRIFSIADRQAEAPV